MQISKIPHANPFFVSTNQLNLHMLKLFELIRTLEGDITMAKAAVKAKSKAPVKKAAVKVVKKVAAKKAPAKKAASKTVAKKKAA
jgi:hypothetical protein